MNEGYQEMSTRRRCDLFRTILSYFIITSNAVLIG